MNIKNKKGIFLVFDGGEGAGKTTVIQRLKETYGERIAISHEPGGCPRAEAIRDQLLSEEGRHFSPEKQFELFWEARRYHMEDVVIPMLQEGKIFICDRFDSATWAYQIYAQHQHHPELKERFWELRERVLGEYVPDCYLIFKIRPEVGLARAHARGEVTHFEEKKLEFHQEVLSGLLDFTSQPGINARIIDAEKTQDEVFEQVLRVVHEFTQI